MTTEEKSTTRWSDRKIGRRSFITKGAAGAGIAVAAMYVAPSLLSSGPKSAYAQVTGGQGCTPGYWKQSQHFWAWTSPCTPSGDFHAEFGLSSAVTGLPSDYTQLQALEHALPVLPKERMLAAHAMAALLNAKSPSVSFALTVGQVKSKTVAAFATGGSAVEDQKDEFDTLNNQGCGLGNSPD